MDTKGKISIDAIITQLLFLVKYAILSILKGVKEDIEGEASLLVDLLWGACIVHYPAGAQAIIRGEAEVYNEIKVMDGLLSASDSRLTDTRASSW